MHSGTVGASWIWWCGSGRAAPVGFGTSLFPHTPPWEAWTGGAPSGGRGSPSSSIECWHHGGAGAARLRYGSFKSEVVFSRLKQLDLIRDLTTWPVKTHTKLGFRWEKLADKKANVVRFVGLSKTFSYFISILIHSPCDESSRDPPSLRDPHQEATKLICCYRNQPTLFLSFGCCNRVENESLQKKKAAAGTKAVKDEDPYGGSTDENTDAEDEQDHPVPELPGEPALIPAAVLSCYFSKCPRLFISCSGGKESCWANPYNTHTHTPRQRLSSSFLLRPFK